MASLKNLFFVVLAAASVAALATDVSAQGGRDAAIHKCIQQARAEFPDGGSGNALTDRNRSQAYMACMTSAGFQP